MDDARFDRLARSFALSRRSAVRAIAGGIAGIVAGAAPKVAAKPRDPFYRAMKPCGRGQECGEKAPCDPTFLVCMPTECYIEKVTYELGDPNPENYCQFCNATTYDHWLNRSRGETCPDTTGNPCIVDFGRCSKNGDCILENVPDGTLCNHGGICCDGECCAPGLSCVDGKCRAFQEDPDGGPFDGGDEDNPTEDDGPPDEEDEDDDEGIPGNPDPGEGCTGPDCAPTCHIGDVEWADGDVNPQMECEVCDPSRNANAWSFADNNTSCGGVPDRYCCEGICCVPGQCCGQVGLCVLNVDMACPDLIPPGN